MILSFIILTWNSEYHIENCLSSLIDNIDKEFQPYEIFVVDNGSDDSTVKILEKYSKRFPSVVKIIQLETNRRTTFSRILALKKAKGNCKGIVDSDVVVPPKFLQPLVSILKTRSDVGMVVPESYIEMEVIKSRLIIFRLFSAK